MRRREEERKAKEAEAKKKEEEAKKKEETARRIRELREREARERERREKEARERELKEKLRQEQEAREKERLERELREKIERELREKVEREAREREAREREAREREAREREAKLREEARKREEERAKAERERLAARERERKEREERAARLRKEQEEARLRKEQEEARLRKEQEEARLRKEQEEKEKEEKEEKERNERKGTAYAYSSVGEKTSMWPNGKPPSVAPSQAASTPPPSRPAPSQAPPSPTKPAPSPTKPAPSPTKSTASASASATGTEDTYSYRPYDTPKKSTARKKSVSDFSESSWAPSHSTARTTPPPSTRGPYTTNDPQKIVIKAVYGYLNQFSKTPASQLISGVGPVTDGLILRITSAGLFVDDDVRGVAQREWDIKAWTLKLVEFWCPVHAVTAQASNTPGSVPVNHPFFKTMPQSARRGAERGATKTMLGEEAVAYIDEFGRTCSGACRKAGTGKPDGLHLLRATIRDQEGKRYLFVVGEEEAWKIAGGLAALRGSSQVRALGVAGFSSLESKTLLDTLGWGG
jgi:cell wall-associated NlpC family hydrolase